MIFCRKNSGQRCCVVAMVVVVGCELFARSQKSRKNEVFVQIWCSSEPGTEFETEWMRSPNYERHNLFPGHLVNTEGLSLGHEFWRRNHFVVEICIDTTISPWAFRQCRGFKFRKRVLTPFCCCCCYSGGGWWFFFVKVRNTGRRSSMYKLGYTCMKLNRGTKSEPSFESEWCTRHKTCQECRWGG